MFTVNEKTIEKLQWMSKYRKSKKGPIRDEKFNSKMKYTLEGMNSKLEYAEKWISDMEVKVMENTRTEQKNKGRIKRNE